MQSFLKSLVIIGLLAVFSLAGCSKKAVMNEKEVSKTKNENVKAANEITKAVRGSSLVKDLKKRDSLNSEVLSDPIKDLKSVKSDNEINENEALEDQSNIAELQKIYFDYDRSDLRGDAKSTLMTNADIIKTKKSTDILIEGYCDERGTEEYNLALGQRRAESVKKYLITLGISDTKMSTISYGEAKPEAHGSNEAAWSQNRRAVLKEIND